MYASRRSYTPENDSLLHASVHSQWPPGQSESTLALGWLPIEKASRKLPNSQLNHCLALHRLPLCAEQVRMSRHGLLPLLEVHGYNFVFRSGSPVLKSPHVADRIAKTGCPLLPPSDAWIQLTRVSEPTSALTCRVTRATIGLFRPVSD